MEQQLTNNCKKALVVIEKSQVNQTKPPNLHNLHQLLQSKFLLGLGTTHKYFKVKISIQSLKNMKHLGWVSLFGVFCSV